MKKILELINKKVTIKLILFILVILITPFSLSYLNKLYESQSLKRQQKENDIAANKLSAELSKIKRWDIDSDIYKELLINEASLKTKYSGGYMYYRFRVSFIKKNDNKFESTSYNDYYALNFLDSDDFTRHTLFLRFKDLTFSVDNGEKIGATWEDKIKIDQSLYKIFSNVKVSWSL